MSSSAPRRNVPSRSERRHLFWRSDLVTPRTGLTHPKVLLRRNGYATATVPYPDADDNHCGHRLGLRGGPSSVAHLAYVPLAILGRGKEGMPLSISVVDDFTGQPIAGVAIQVSPRPRPDLRRDLAPVRGTTGADGAVRLATIARAWGRRWTANWEGFQPVDLWKTEEVSLSGVSIEAEAPGYEQAQWSLVKNPGRSPVTIRLRPSISTDLSLRRR